MYVIFLTYHDDDEDPITITSHHHPALFSSHICFLISCFHSVVPCLKEGKITPVEWVWVWQLLFSPDSCEERQKNAYDRLGVCFLSWQVPVHNSSSTCFSRFFTSRSPPHIHPLLSFPSFFFSSSSFSIFSFSILFFTCGRGNSEQMGNF